MENIDINNPLQSLNIEDSKQIKYEAPSFQFHAFSNELNDVKYSYQVVKMDNSVFIWIGTGLEFNHLSMSMISNITKAPMSTAIIGGSAENNSTNIAVRLTKRLGKPVLVSYNGPDDRLILPWIEKRLNDEIKKNPGKF